MEQNNNGAAGIVQEYPKGAPLYREEKKKGHPVLIAFLVLVILAAGAYSGLCAYANSLDQFYPNRSINGVPVGGLTAEQAQQKLEETLLSQVITIHEEKSGDMLTAVTLGEIGYSAESFAGDARWWLEQQQDIGFFYKGWEFFQAFTGKRSGGANWPDLEESTLGGAVEKICESLSEAPIHASYALEETGIRVQRARVGRKLDEAAVAAALRPVAEYCKNGYQVWVEFEVLPADDLTAAEIHGEVYSVMQNAGYDIASGSITADALGVDFDIPAAQSVLDAAQPGESVLISAHIERPAVTAAELEEVLFRDVLGECRTLVSGTAARRNNVSLSAQKINGWIMNAGDVFSYNQTVGKRTEEAGFQAAPAYVQGETVDEVGGGICQTSSTLYYACLKANLEITERYAHRYVPAYIDWGMDATVSWGGPDYKFTNSTLYPMKIETEYKGGYLTVRVIGTNVDGVYAKMTNDVLSKTDWTTEYVEDPTMAPGAQVEKTTPYTGYKVKSYRHVYDKDGNLISSELEDTSNYKVRNRVILRGPAVVAEPSAPAAEVTPLPEEVPEEAEAPVEIILGDA